MDKDFRFELIAKSDIHSQPHMRDYNDHIDTFKLYREISTDTLWVYFGSLAQMHDPETGLPLTYKVWKEKYHNEQ